LGKLAKRLLARGYNAIILAELEEIGYRSLSSEKRIRTGDFELLRGGIEPPSPPR
jgi:hypothetical protein